MQNYTAHFVVRWLTVAATLSGKGYVGHLGEIIAPSARWSATSSRWLICSGNAVAVAVADAKPTLGGLSVTSNKIACTF